ncbi:hypothetical protein M0804_009662 [Polistes exclamans]|nr:hypothetical protein M0804_009662 [Polistes exclamans]
MATPTQRNNVLEENGKLKQSAKLFLPKSMAVEGTSMYQEFNVEETPGIVVVVVVVGCVGSSIVIRKKNKKKKKKPKGG